MEVENENEDKSPHPEKKARYFCARSFRRELKTSDALKSLKKFVSEAHNSDTVVLEYFEKGGSVQEILSLIDSTAKGDLTTALPVFEVLHLIFLRFQAPNSTYHKHCIDGAKFIISSHAVTITSLLSMNTVKHKKVALKLLTAIVTLHPSFPNEVINLFSPSTTLIEDMITPRPEKDSVRKYFILFILSFLVEGSQTVLKTIMDSKGFLRMIIPGLKYDDATTVNMALSLMENNVLKNEKISKTLKLKTFNTQIIKTLFELYDWKGIQELKQQLAEKGKRPKLVEVNEKDKALVVESVHSFLLVLCTSKKHGVSFPTKSLTTLDTTNNQLLLTVFEGLSNPLNNDKISEILLKTLTTCPDLIKPTLVKLEPFFQPRNSKNWFDGIQFAESLVSQLDVTNLIRDNMESASANQILKMAKVFCTPIIFLKAVKSGVEKSQALEVRIRSFRLLLTMWSATRSIVQEFQAFESYLKKSLNDNISKFLPNVEELVELWREVCSEEFLKTFSNEIRLTSIPVLLESLRIVTECQENLPTSATDLASDLLLHLDNVKDTLDGKQFLDTQAKIVECIESNLGFLKPDTDLFKTVFSICLQSSEALSLSCAVKLISNLEVFNKNKAEVDVWLMCFTDFEFEDRVCLAECFLESLYECLQGSPEGDITLQDKSEENEQSTDRESCSTFLIYAVNTLKSYSSNLEENSLKISVYKGYLHRVILQLRHMYPNDESVYAQLKSHKKTLGKSLIEYLKAWSTNSLSSDNFDVLDGSNEKVLAQWLNEPGAEPTSFQDVLNTTWNVFKYSRSFNIVLGYLVLKTRHDALSDVGVEKFSRALSYFLKSGDGNTEAAESKRTSMQKIRDRCLISSDVENPLVYRRNCLESLFFNKSLLKAFDIFASKKKNCSLVIGNALMDTFKPRQIPWMKKITESWKVKFLNDLKNKFKKGKSIDDVGMFQLVLNFFEYENSEAKDMVNLLTNVTDFSLFLHGGNASKWTVALVKFLEVHCKREELNHETIKQLCSLMKFFSDHKCSPESIAVLDNCFVYLLREHPKHLLLFKKDFIQLLLRRTNLSPSAVTLGKLLLNNPAMVQHLLKVSPKHLDSQLLPHLVSTLVVDEIGNSFIETIHSEDTCLVWTRKDMPQELLSLLKSLYDCRRDSIVSAMKGDPDDFTAENASLAQALVDLFVEETDVKTVKKAVAKGKFHTELVFAAVKKLRNESLAESYLKGFIIMISRAIENSNTPLEENTLKRYSYLVSNVLELFNECKWESVISVLEEKDFYKHTLRLCLNTSQYPSLLKIVRILVETFHPLKENTKTTAHFFQMLISHSQFLNVILKSSPVKEELLRLYQVLIVRSTTEMSSKHIPVLLASYTASLSASDIVTLEILKFYEERGFKFGDYEPLAWGETAVSHYSIKTATGLSLWQRFSMTNVLDLLDSQKLENSIIHFPIHRDLQVRPFSEPMDGVYDPAFLLPLFTNLLSPGAIVFPLPFIYKGALAYSVRALASECSDVRMAASVVLTRFYNHLELNQNLKQKLVWMHFINCIRYGTENLSKEPIPNIITLFLGRMSLELSQPPGEMHQPLQNYLLAKSFFQLNSIPEFLPLFHSSQVSFPKHREWLLNVLKEGTKTEEDVKVIFYSMAFKIIFCFFHSPLCNVEMKKLILQVLQRVITTEKSIILISEYGLLAWLNAIDPNSHAPVLPDLLQLLLDTTKVILKDITFNKGKHASSSDVLQVLNITMKILPAVTSVKSVPAFSTFLEILSISLVSFYNRDKCDWFQLNRNKLKDLVKTGTHILGTDCGKFTNVPFYFREYTDEHSSDDTHQNLKNVVFLFHKLITKHEVVCS